MALLGTFNVHRHGAINSAAIVLYALTSCVSGYISCSFYTQINGQRWVWNIILTSSLFSGELDTKDLGFFRQNRFLDEMPLVIYHTLIRHNISFTDR